MDRYEVFLKLYLIHITFPSHLPPPHPPTTLPPHCCPKILTTPLAPSSDSMNRAQFDSVPA